MGMNTCFGCVTSGHIVRDFTKAKTQRREINQAQISVQVPMLSRKNTSILSSLGVIKRVLRCC